MLNRQLRLCIRQTQGFGTDPWLRKLLWLLIQLTIHQYRWPQKLTRSDTSLQTIEIQDKLRYVQLYLQADFKAPHLLSCRNLCSQAHMFKKNLALLGGQSCAREPKPSARQQYSSGGAQQYYFTAVFIHLHRTGDGNVSFALSRKSSLGTILPKPDEPPVAGYMDFARPAAMYADCDASPFDFATSSPFVNNGMSSSPVVGQRTENQSTSILYTRIQHLSKQLKSQS